jgi:hypothetical protein
VDQALVVGYWLGIAGVALLWANLHLWHTRRVLNQLRQDLGVRDGRLVPIAEPVPIAVPVPFTALVPVAAAELAS